MTIDTAGLVARLEAFGQAYPEKAFPPITDEERLWLMRERPGLLDRISADMGRHFAKFATQAAEALTAEALTAQAAVPDMEPVAWQGDHQVDGEYTRKFTAIKRVAEIWADQGINVEPLYSASQLSAMQERLERAVRERDAALRIKEMSSKALAFEKQLVRADAAEARGRDTAIGILQSEIDNPTSHDPSICLDAAIRKLQENGNGPGGAG